MKGILPNEFPFTRKRKPARRKESATEAVVAPAATEVAATPEATAPAVTAPAVAAPAPEAAVAVAPVAAAPVVAAPQAPAPVENAETRVIPVNRHATSRASITPVATGAALPQTPVVAAKNPAVATVEPVLAYKGPERRRSPRQSLRAKAVYRNDLNPAAAGPVQILNFSMCGVRLWSNRSMKVGERATVKMEIGPVKWTGRVKVVTCNPQDDEGYALGCEFATNEVARRSVA
jgi:hypothetical protein